MFLKICLMALILVFTSHTMDKALAHAEEKKSERASVCTDAECPCQKLSEFKEHVLKCESKSNLLIAAIQNEHLEVVNLLLSLGADPNKIAINCKYHDEFRYCNKCHPVRLAAYRGNIPIFLALRAAGGEVGSLTMDDAVESGNLKMVQIISDLGYKNKSWANLRSAVCQGNGTVVEFLIKHSNLRPLDQDYWGFNYTTLIRESIENAEPEITHMLLDACPGFNINSVHSCWRPIPSAPITRSERPLNTALRKKKFVLAKNLIQRGAWVNPPSIDNYLQSFHLNPLWQAAQTDNKEAVEFLLQNGADPNHLASGTGKSKEGEPIIEILKRNLSCPHADQILELLREQQKPTVK